MFNNSSAAFKYQAPQFDTTGKGYTIDTSGLSRLVDQDVANTMRTIALESANQERLGEVIQQGLGIVETAAARKSLANLKNQIGELDPTSPDFERAYSELIVGNQLAFTNEKTRGIASAILDPVRETRTEHLRTQRFLQSEDYKLRQGQAAITDATGYLDALSKLDRNDPQFAAENASLVREFSGAWATPESKALVNAGIEPMDALYEDQKSEATYQEHREQRNADYDARAEKQRLEKEKEDALKEEKTPKLTEGEIKTRLTAVGFQDELDKVGERYDDTRDDLKATETDAKKLAAEIEEDATSIASQKARLETLKKKDQRESAEARIITAEAQLAAKKAKLEAKAKEAAEFEAALAETAMRKSETEKITAEAAQLFRYGKASDEALRALMDKLDAVKSSTKLPGDTYDVGGGGRGTSAELFAPDLPPEAPTAPVPVGAKNAGDITPGFLFNP